MRFERAKAERLLLDYANEKRRECGLEPFVYNPVLRNLARNHSYRMSRKDKIWRHDKASKIPKLIPNPIEATIAWALITLGFVVAWVFALIGLVVLKLGRKGYKKKVKEDVAVILVKGKDLIRNRHDKVAREIQREFEGQEEYRTNMADSVLRLNGVGIQIKGNAIYATHIFYG